MGERLANEVHFLLIEVNYVMNSTCIHMRTGGPNICMYRGGGDYTKNPLEKYNNRKSYYTSNKLMFDRSILFSLI
jgi:hypothetical protein